MDCSLGRVVADLGSVAGRLCRDSRGSTPCGVHGSNPVELNLSDVVGVRRFNRSVGNPRTMATAGQPRAYASVIQHQGRTSGSTYDTPIVPFTTSDGFVIPLPYGARADWVKNVRHRVPRSSSMRVPPTGLTDPRSLGVTSPRLIFRQGTSGVCACPTWTKFSEFGR